ncbi:MAG: hypothetical protein OHK0052_13670 [Anaerolineales bacterium]
MEQIVKLVVEKTGISEAQAQTAVETVIAQLKQRLPEPYAKNLDTLLASDLSSAVDKLDDVAGMLGGFLGKKK